MVHTLTLSVEFEVEMSRFARRRIAALKFEAIDRIQNGHRHSETRGRLRTLVFEQILIALLQPTRHETAGSELALLKLNVSDQTECALNARRGVNTRHLPEHDLITPGIVHREMHILTRGLIQTLNLPQLALFEESRSTLITLGRSGKMNLNRQCMARRLPRTIEFELSEWVSYLHRGSLTRSVPFAAQRADTRRLHRRQSTAFLAIATDDHAVRH